MTKSLPQLYNLPEGQSLKEMENKGILGNKEMMTFNYPLVPAAGQ